MRQVCLLSMFSTSVGYLERYFVQVATLHHLFAAYGYALRLVLCEGDSTDDTYPQIQQWVARYGLNATLLQHHHGNEVYGSVVDAQRFRQLSCIWNEMLDQVRPEDEYVIIVESDLIWFPTVIMALWDDVQSGAELMAPMIMYGDQFYDTWAYRRNGQHFSPWPPFHPELGDLRLELDSAGSCLVMLGEVARRCRTTEEAELVGFCQQARANGYKLWLNPGRIIRHP